MITAWLLWARIVVCIDSYHDQYYFSFGGLIKAEPNIVENSILLKIGIPFYSFNLDPMKQEKKKDKPKRKKKPRKKEGRRLSLAFYLMTGLEALKTFSFKHFLVDIDTGDYVLNAKLTPVMVALNHSGAQLRVNYHGELDLWIEIENRLVRFIPIAFRFVKEKYF